MNKCFYCSQVIEQNNDSKEHIIPNSIGGKAVINGFICKRCNSKTGDEWDALLSKQLNWMCLLLGDISRYRGTNKPEIFNTISGEAFKIDSAGNLSIAKPLFKEITDEKGVTNYRITAPNEEYAKKMWKSLVKKDGRLKDVNIDENKSINYQSIINDPLVINPEFGGREAGKSAVKTMLSYAKSCGINTESCNLALDYIVNDGESAFGFYYGEDLIIDRSFEMPSHAIAITADPNTGRIIAYIEYFNVWRLISLLGDNYKGEAISKSYFIYPENSDTGIFKIKKDISLETIYKSYDYQIYDKEIMTSAMGGFLKYCQIKKETKMIDEILQGALEKTIKSFGGNDELILNESEKLDFISRFSKQLEEDLLTHKARLQHSDG